MRKIAILLVLLVSCSFAGKAQTGIIGGGLTLFYSNGFLYQATLHGGYEFNDKIATTAMIGIGAAAEGNGSYVVGETGIYFRFTAWHNDVFFLDFKPAFEMAFRDYISVMDIGIVPSLRFRTSPHWEIFTDIGAFGARYNEGVWRPRLGITNITAAVGVNYRF